MRDLFSRYALRFNRKYERKGHLFGGPYRQAVCLEDSYLLAASLYIHLNPVRAGLISDPRLYRWSSCRLYCNDRAPRSFVKPEFILNLLKEEDNQKESYREMLRQSLQLEMGEILEREDAIDSFRSRLAAALPQFFRKLARINQVAEHSGIKFSSSEEIEELMEKVRNGRFKNKAESREGRRYLIEQLIARGYRREEICNRLGMTRKTIYNILHPG